MAIVAGALLVAIAIGMVRASPAPVAAAPNMVEEGGQAGLGQVYQGDFDYFVGGGVAVFDCNEDGKPDVFTAGGTNPARLYRNVGGVGGPIRFQALPAPELSHVTGAYPLDIDSDGITDLAVLRIGENMLLRGDGDCSFGRANEEWGFDGGNEQTEAFSATWERGASLPTLAVGNYLEQDPPSGAAVGCAQNQLFRPAQDGGYGQPIGLDPSWCALSMLFSDWDHSGQVDLRVSNDRHYYLDGEEQLWNVSPGEPPRLYTRAEGWQKLQIWGMGIASQDLTGDGRPEVFLTSQSDNKLQTLTHDSGSPDYSDIALRTGAIAYEPYAGDTDMPSTAWHPEFEDVNNDGYMDLFISKGNVEAMPDYAARDPNNLLIGQPGGSFQEGAMDAGIVRFSRGRGAAMADFNLDGMLDLVVINRREPASLFRNVGTGTAEGPVRIGNWLAVRLHQPAPNTDAIGAWVEVEAGGRSISRELTVGGGHAGGQLGWVHFGLGNAERAKVRVQWPNGAESEWMTVDANSFIDIDRAAADVAYWQPGEG
ncbi:MAG TPA: CRTAC1 family protein [Acidimicrobiia bacterium]